MATVKVKVGEFRNHLSAYLKKVRQGREFVITDRETPIGVVIPFSFHKSEAQLELLEPSKGFEGLARLNFEPISLQCDPLQFLLEDRNRR